MYMLQQHIYIEHLAVFYPEIDSAVAVGLYFPLYTNTPRNHAITHTNIACKELKISQFTQVNQLFSSISIQFDFTATPFIGKLLC